MAEHRVGKEMDGPKDWLVARKQIGNPSQEETNIFMRAWPDLRLQITKVCVGDREKTFKDLVAEKIKFEAKAGKPMSRLDLCAGHILKEGIITTFFNKAKRHYYAGELEEFRFYFDVFKIGAEFPLGGILEKEKVSGGTDVDMLPASYVSERFNVDAGEAADMYLLSESMGKNNLRFLSVAPSGISLINDFCDKFRSGYYSTTWFSTDYTVAGAKLLRDLYRTLYELGAPLFSQAQTK